MDWAGLVRAVVMMWYPGQEAGHALADVLTGKVNPSGRLPTTFPKKLEDSPAFAHYPGADGRAVYGEGVFVGYRHFDTHGVEPLFPFGHGLSYTTFDYRHLKVDGPRVSVDVTNTGKRAGAEIVQVYVRPLDASVPRPDRELKAFAKVHLEPGQTETVAFELPLRAFQHWDGGWRGEGGRFEVLVGASSRDIRAGAGIGSQT